MKHLLNIILISFLLFIVACTNDISKINDETIISQSNAIREFYTPYDKATEGSWREAHPEEKYETLNDYKSKKPSSITNKRNKIYIIPVGEFSNDQLSIIKETTSYIEAFYGIGVFQVGVRNTPNVSSSMKRINNGKEQINANYFLTDYISINEFSDAAVVIALTSFDLYPQESWNYVFGLASLQNRVGVWSLFRFGNPSIDSNSYKICLERTRKVATHEIGHMFSIKHCVVYPCIMNGSNSMSETDRQPLLLCPDCMEKLCWNFKNTPQVHCERMLSFWKIQKDTLQISMYEAFLEAIKK